MFVVIVMFLCYNKHNKAMNIKIGLCAALAPLRDMLCIFVLGSLGTYPVR